MLGIDVLILIVLVVGFFTVIRKLKTMQELISQLLATASEQTTVVESFIAYHEKALAEVQAKVDAGDLAGVGEAVSTLRANTAKLAKAMAANTEASDEVHTNDGDVTGGTGDAETVVDAPTVAADAGAPEQEVSETPTDGAEG
jgi:hypothetical protein